LDAAANRAPYYAGVSRDGIGLLFKAILPDVTLTRSSTSSASAGYVLAFFCLRRD
jgi:hypothetical protein